MRTISFWRKCQRAEISIHLSCDTFTQSISLILSHCDTVGIGRLKFFTSYPLHTFNKSMPKIIATHETFRYLPEDIPWNDVSCLIFIPFIFLPIVTSVRDRNNLSKKLLQELKAKECLTRTWAFAFGETSCNSLKYVVNSLHLDPRKLLQEN